MFHRKHSFTPAMPAAARTTATEPGDQGGCCCPLVATPWPSGVVGHCPDVATHK